MATPKADEVWYRNESDMPILIEWANEEYVGYRLESGFQWMLPLIVFNERYYKKTKEE